VKATTSEFVGFFVSLFVVSILAVIVVRAASHQPAAAQPSSFVAAAKELPPPRKLAPPIVTPSPVQVATVVEVADPETVTTTQRIRSHLNGPRMFVDSAGEKTTMNNFLWGVYPYLCIVLFFVVPIIRMVTRPYSWSTRASGIFGRRVLGIASMAFHWGLLLLLGGHVIGLIGGVLGAESAVDIFFWSGLVGGFLVLIGSTMALVRRIGNAEVRAMSQPEDYIVQLFLISIVSIALYQVVAYRIFGITYSVSSWAASLWTLSPQPELMESVGLLTKLHVFLALLFFAYFPFTKLVHFWTFPVNYFVRPPQSMRTQRYRFQRRWEFAWRSDKSWLVYGLGSVAVLFLIAGGLLGSPRNAGANDLPESVRAGDAVVLAGYPLYISQCARCHGTDGYGDGAGMDSPTFAALPRSLVYSTDHPGATYHFASTDNGIASDDDLFRTIAEGLDGSGMPAFADLTAAQILSLVDVLNAFRAEGPEPGNPIHVPEYPQPTAASIARGQSLFAESCVSCHGEDGSGGTQQNYSWRELGPEEPQIIAAADLSQGLAKVGLTPDDIFTRITVGVPGAFGGSNLMQSFKTMPAEDRWAIVHYVMEEILPQSTDRLSDG
jgi:nitrate reductase gamma subunit